MQMLVCKWTGLNINEVKALPYNQFREYSVVAKGLQDMNRIS